MKKKKKVSGGIEMSVVSRGKELLDLYSKEGGVPSYKNWKEFSEHMILVGATKASVKSMQEFAKFCVEQEAISVKQAIGGELKFVSDIVDQWWKTLFYTLGTILLIIVINLVVKDYTVKSTGSIFLAIGLINHLLRGILERYKQIKDYRNKNVR